MLRLPRETQLGSSTGLVTAPATDVITIKNDTTTGARGSEDTTDVTRPWDQPTTIELVGSVPLGVKISDDLAPAVPDPPAYALDVFRLDLIQDGIDIGTTTQAQYTPPPATTTIWKRSSEPLSKTLGLFWQPSDNLIAEQLLLELGASSPTAAPNARRSAHAEAATMSSNRGCNRSASTRTL